MRFPSRRILTSGSFLTALAAGLVAFIGVLPNLWPELFGVGPHGRAPGQAKLLAYLVMPAALLTRWRPMRWVVMFSLIPLAAFAILGSKGLYANPGWAMTGWAAAIALAILASPPVGRYFRKPRSEWGDDEEPEGAPSPMLPAEKVGPGIAAVSGTTAAASARPDRSGPPPRGSSTACPRGRGRP